MRELLKTRCQMEDTEKDNAATSHKGVCYRQEINLLTTCNKDIIYDIY